jgi:hypothetical protein
MAAAPYDHVLGCIREIERQMHRVDVAQRAAVDAIRARELDKAREWLNDAHSEGEQLLVEARTAILALSAARDREGS